MRGSSTSFIIWQQYGTVGVVLANGSMSSNASGEGDIRQNLMLANLVDCVVVLPDALFYSIPACL